MAKKAHLTILPEEIHKYSNWLEAEEAETFFNHSRDRKWVDKLIYTMDKWVRKETSETVQDFCNEYCFDPSRLKELRDKDERFAKYYIVFKKILANKDIKGVKHKIYDREMVMKYLHTLDADYLEINKYHADLKNEEAKNSGTVYVEVRPTKSFPEEPSGPIIDEAGDKNKAR